MSGGASQRADWPSAIVFDLDGTLVDSAGDIATALNTVLASKNIPPFPLTGVIDFIGNGIPALLTKAFAARGTPLDADALASVLAEFRMVYSRCLIDTTKPYAGLAELADRLTQRGIRLGVCTNKEESFAARIIEGLGLRSRFPVVVGGMPGRPAKPSADPLLETIAKLGGEPGTAIMVGDSVADLTCAQNANVAFIGVSFGYSRVPLGSLGAATVIDRFADFDDACRSLRIGD